MTTLPPISSELAEAARREERQAEEPVLARCAAEDLRGQLEAAVQLLVERTGQTREQVNAAIASRRAANLKGAL